MPLVAIRDLTEAQAKAWVAGPFSAECGRECVRNLNRHSSMSRIYNDSDD